MIDNTHTKLYSLSADMSWRCLVIDREQTA